MWEVCKSLFCDLHTLKRDIIALENRLKSRPRRAQKTKIWWKIHVFQAATIITLILGVLFTVFYPFLYKTTVSINSVCSFSVFDNDSLVSIKKAENELELLNKRIIRIRQEQKIDNLVFLDLCN